METLHTRNGSEKPVVPVIGPFCRYHGGEEKCYGDECYLPALERAEVAAVELVADLGLAVTSALPRYIDDGWKVSQWGRYLPKQYLSPRLSFLG